MSNENEKSSSRAARAQRRFARLEHYRQQQYEELDKRLTRLEKRLKI